MLCDPVKLVWQLWTDEASPALLKAKAITMFTLVMGINVIVWALLLIFTASYPYFFTSGKTFPLPFRAKVPQKPTTCAIRFVSLGIGIKACYGCGSHSRD